MKHNKMKFRVMAASIVTAAFCCTGLTAAALLSEEPIAVLDGIPLFSGRTESCGESNLAPIAEHIDLKTYRNVAIQGDFTAVDPEGDLIHYQLLEKPARGAVTMPAEGESSFLYTPYENKTGKDSFTYLALDSMGNASAPATVRIKISKPDTKVRYSDLEDHPAHKAAIQLAEHDLFVGECLSGVYFFRPDAPVSREEFLSLTMKAAGIKPMEEVDRTGFADDSDISAWAKNYASSALKAGLIQGKLGPNGRAVFYGSQPITAAEAAVVLDRALGVTDLPDAWKDSEEIPSWAAQAAANMASCGLLPAEYHSGQKLACPLTRAEAAVMLSGALEFTERQDSWLPW